MSFEHGRKRRNFNEGFLRSERQQDSTKKKKQNNESRGALHISLSKKSWVSVLHKTSEDNIRHYYQCYKMPFKSRNVMIIRASKYSERQDMS